MKYLFQENGRKLLKSFSFANPLLALDFDGTLAPIVNEPGQAKCSKTIEDLLRELQSYYPLAIISGRSLDDLKPRIPKGILLVGNHGLEGLTSKSSSLERLQKVNSDWLECFDKEKGLRSLGVKIENKYFSLALHFRNSNRKQAAKAEILQFCATLKPQPRIILGKSVVNVLPAGAPHKGVALLELMKHFQAESAIYVGDDDTDEDVFSLPDERILSIRVGMKRDSLAQFYLKRQNEVSRLLKELLNLRANGR